MVDLRRFSTSTKRELAYDDYTPREWLDKLADDEYCNVIQAVAQRQKQIYNED